MLRYFQPTDQNANNTLRFVRTEIGLPADSTTDLMKCQYSTTVATFASLDSATIQVDGGTATQVSFPGGAQTTAAGVKDQIIALAEAQGFLLDDDPRDVAVTLNGADLQIECYGELVFVSFHDGGTSYTSTQKCNTSAVADYITTYAGSTNPVLTVDGTSATVTGTFSNDSTGAANLETALQGEALLSGYTALTAVYNTTLGGIVITVTTGLGKTIVFDGKTLSEENPQQVFTV